MKVCAVVLLLFFLSCAEFQRSDDQLSDEDVDHRLNQLQNKNHGEKTELLTDRPTSQPDMWTELRELRSMVVEQKVQLSSAQCQLQNSQSRIEELKKENAEINSRLLASEQHVEELKHKNSELEERVISTELGIEGLLKEKTNNLKVAFSFGSGVYGSLGPFNVDTLLVFRKEYINIGKAYSPITGMFTAPVRGVYYFRFNIFGSGSSWAAACLFKNQERILYVSESPDGKNEYASNGVSLLLEKGDLVYLKLAATTQIWDSSDSHCSFSGFLLFYM